MVGTGSQRRSEDGASPRVWVATDGTVHPERRVRRSRLPVVLAVVGAVVGTLVADLLILALFGESVVQAASAAGWNDLGPLVQAVVAMRDPSLALASLVLGGLPGTLIGHTLAVRVLRKARLDSLLRGGG